MVPAAGDPVVGVDVVAVLEDTVGREEAGGTTLLEDGPYGTGTRTPLAVLSTFPGVELGVDGEGVPDYLACFGPPVDEGVVVEVGVQLEEARGDVENLDGGFVGGRGQTVAEVEPAAVGGWEGEVGGVEWVELVDYVSQTESR